MARPQLTRDGQRVTLKPHPGPFTRQQLIDAVERELALRRDVYASRVEQMKMKPGVAEWELGLMTRVRDLVASLPAKP